MAAPRSVKNAAKHAEQLQKEIAAGQNQGSNPQIGDVVQLKPGEVGSQADVDGSGPPAAGLPDEGGAGGADQGNWELRFKTLKAKHDDTVFKLRTDLKKTTGELEKATNAMAQLRGEFAELKQSMTDSPAAAEPGKVTVTDAEIEEYGQGLIDLIGKVAPSHAEVDLAKQVLDLSRRLDSMADKQTQITETTQATGRSAFIKELDGLAPNWRTINKKVAFHNWLAGEHPGTGEERQYYLTKKYDEMDAEGVASFFITFSEQENSASDVSELDEDLHPTPSGADTVDSGANNQKPIYTRAMIKQFYDDKRAGKYDNKRDEAKRIEADILAAPREGRVRG